jgi:hypothetical protein
MTIEDLKVFDNSIKNADIINFVKKWVKAYDDELLESWKAAKKGKALLVPNNMPKEVKSFIVKKIKDLQTTKDLKMIIHFEDEDEARIVDFKHDVISKNKAFKILESPKIFQSAKAQKSAVIWESVNIDIEATDLYEISKPISYSKKIAEAMKLS